MKREKKEAIFLILIIALDFCLATPTPSLLLNMEMDHEELKTSKQIDAALSVIEFPDGALDGFNCTSFQNSFDMKIKAVPLAASLYELSVVMILR